MQWAIIDHPLLAMEYEVLLELDRNDNYTLKNTTYFYQSCVSDYKKAAEVVNECTVLKNSSGSSEECVQFCDRFRDSIPDIYLGVSCLSAFCCMWVFVTFFTLPRLRQSGYSSKVFLYRTLMDLLIAVGHIVSRVFELAEAQTMATFVGCRIVGSINEFALVASNLWYVLLAVDLIKAIRNPFSARPYGVLSHIMVWGFSLICLAIIALLILVPGPSGPGPSMFFWCWAEIEGVNRTITNFGMVTLFLYYLWHSLFWVFSLVVLIMAAGILWGRLPASSETRKFVLKQNFLYVCVLGIETAIILPLWIIQLALLRVLSRNSQANGRAYFLTNIDFGLAVVYAVVHSLRGTVDLIVWLATFSIGRSDIKDVWFQVRTSFSRKNQYLPSRTLKTPLLTSKGDSQVNKALRRNAMYCINVGILDAVTLNLEHQGKVGRVGSVRDSFVAAAMMDFDEENQRQKTAKLYENPQYREQSLREIKFPASASIQKFAFIDLEPSVFSLLRASYHINPKLYRKSFQIKNAAEIDSSRMLEKFTEGKSGQFFYFTRDLRYIIKTVTDEEEQFLQKIAYKYYNHMRNHPNSLIVRFFGLHKVRLAPEQRFISVVVMENIFYNSDQPCKIHERYDLKGSTVGRRSLKGGRVRGTYKGTLKDLDLGNGKVVIGPESKEALMDQLRADVEFLTECKIMDYSMLLGIHHHSAVGDDSTLSPMEHSVRGQGGDFVDVDFEPRRNTMTTSVKAEIHHSIGSKTESIVMQEHTSVRRSPRSPRVSNAKPLALEETDEWESSLNEQPHIPWFRQDYGGLRSFSPLHPLYLEELQIRGPSLAMDQVQEGSPLATYYFGVIDILQQYTLQKKMEHFVKTRILCQDKHGISCVNEKEYGQRFLDFMDKIFE